MANNGQAGDAKQRCAAKLRVVDAAPESAERTARQQIPHLARKGPLQFIAEQRLDGVNEALARLQHDVARKAVADDHVRDAAVDLASFDIADEVER